MPFSAMSRADMTAQSSSSCWPTLASGVIQIPARTLELRDSAVRSALTNSITASHYTYLEYCARGQPHKIRISPPDAAQPSERPNRAPGRTGASAGMDVRAARRGPACDRRSTNSSIAPVPGSPSADLIVPGAGPRWSGLSGHSCDGVKTNDKGEEGLTAGRQAKIGAHPAPQPPHPNTHPPAPP
jgi:hypothetical protein